MKRHVKNKVFSAIISQLLVVEPLLKIFMLTSPIMLVNVDAVVPSTTTPAATIQRLDVQCAENGMNVLVEFNQPFNGVIFSKGFYNDGRCVYANRSNSKTIQFSISSGSCGTVVGKFNPNAAQHQTRVKRESPFAVAVADNANAKAEKQLDFSHYNNQKFELLARNSLRDNFTLSDQAEDKRRQSLPVIRVNAVESIRPVITLQHPFSLSPASDDPKPAETVQTNKIFSDNSSVSAQFVPSTLHNASQAEPPIVIIHAVTTKQKPGTTVNSTDLHANVANVTKTRVVIVAPQAPLVPTKQMTDVAATEKQLAADALPKTAKTADEARLLKSIHNVDVPVVNGNPPPPHELLNERQMGRRQADSSGSRASNPVNDRLYSTLTERANPMDSFDTDEILTSNNRNKLQGRTNSGKNRGSLPSALDPRVGDPMAVPLLDDLNAEASRVVPDLTRDVPDVPSMESLHSRMSIKQEPNERIKTEAGQNLMSPRTNIHMLNDDQHRTSRIRFGEGGESDDMSIIFSNNRQRNRNRKHSVLDLRAPTSVQHLTGEKPIEPAGFGAETELSVLADLPNSDKALKTDPRQSDQKAIDKVRQMPSNLNIPPMPLPNFKIPPMPSPNFQIPSIPPPNFNLNGGQNDRAPVQQREGMYPPGVGGGFFGGGGDGIALIGKNGGALHAKTNLNRANNNNNINVMDNGGYGHFGSPAFPSKNGKSNSQSGFNPETMAGILAANGGRLPPNGKPRKVLDLRAPYGGGPEQDVGDPGLGGQYFQQPPRGKFAGFAGPAGGGAGLQRPGAGAPGTNGMNVFSGMRNGQSLNLRAPEMVVPHRDDSGPGFASNGRYFSAPPSQMGNFGPPNGFNGRFNNGPPFNGGGPQFGMMPPMMNGGGGPQAMHFGGPGGGQNPNALTSRQIFPPQHGMGGFGGPPPQAAPGQIAENDRFKPGFDPGFGTFDAGKNQFLDGIPTNGVSGGGKGNGIREANPNFDVDSVDVPEPNGAAFGDFHEPGGGIDSTKFVNFGNGPNFGGGFPGGGRGPLQQFINNGPARQPPRQAVTQRQQPAKHTEIQISSHPLAQQAQPPSIQINVQTEPPKEQQSSSSGVVVINSAEQQPTTSKISPTSQRQINLELQALIEQEAQQADQRLRDEANRQKQLLKSQKQTPLAPLLIENVVNSTIVPIQSRLNFQQPPITLPSLELEQPSVTNVVLPSLELQQQSTSNIVVPSVQVQQPPARNLVLPSLESQMQQLQSADPQRQQHQQLPQQSRINIHIDTQKYVAPVRATTTTQLPPITSATTYNSNSNDYIENVIIIQNDPDLQEVFDVARALRCEWRNSYRKTVGTESRTSDGLQTGAMLQTIMADVEMMRFTGDDVDIWMQLKSGKGPDAQPVSGIVPLGHPMTLVIGLNDPKNEFDLRVGRCQANDGNDHKIFLTDDAGCVIKSKVMRQFEKARNWGANKATIAFSEFSAFKFPEKTEVYIECDVEACKGSCADMCPTSVRRLQLGRSLTNDDAVPRPNTNGSTTESSTSTASHTMFTLSAMRKRRSTGGNNATNEEDEQLKSLRSMYKAVSHNDLAFNFAPELLQLDRATMEQLIAMGTSESAAPAAQAQRAAESAAENDPTSESVCVTRTTLIACVALGSTLATIAVVLLVFIFCRACSARRHAAKPKQLHDPSKVQNSGKVDSSSRMVVGRY